MVASNAEARASIVSKRRASPGRWLGGAVGALICLGIVAAGQVLAESGATRRSSGGSGLASLDGLTALGLGGLPIAILVGRALLPAARSSDWLPALGVGLAFGLIAPPLGAFEVVAIATLPDSGSSSGFGEATLGFLFLLPIALVYSYIAAVVTIPGGLLWVVVIRALPDSLLEALAIGRPLDRLGARHVIGLAGLAWIGLMVRPYAADATDGFTCLELRPAPGAYAWDANGQRLAVIVQEESTMAGIGVVDAAGRLAPIEQPPDTWSTLPAVAPDGTVAWVAYQEGDDGSHGQLWVADEQGSRSIAVLPRDRWIGLAWWDGSWMLAGEATGGLVRVGPRTGGGTLIPAVAAGQRLGSWGTVTGISSSADGRTIAWFAKRDWPDERRLTVADGDGLQPVALPPDAFDVTLDPGGLRVVYREGPNGVWRSRAIDGTDTIALLGSDWSGVRLAANGAIAAEPERVHRGQVCLAPGSSTSPGS
jgi:hypothetical protein